MRAARHRRLFLLALLVVSLVLPRLLPAEEMPLEKRAHGKRETVLAGIDLARKTLADVQRLYGPPDHVDKTPTPPGFSEIEYVWERPGRNRLAVRTRNEEGEPERLVEIDVWGEKPTGRLGRTGRGLPLGCSLQCVEKIYGKRYEVLRAADHGRLAIWIAWDEDWSLNLDFDDHQRVNHIQVARNEED
ncbi:MAG TPA: hypothetical protein VFE33_22210 [Thermoanaerobaculia bacterium]|nr:hypothetical protein [Thermoanaerobaculia bacterium]